MGSVENAVDPEQFRGAGDLFQVQQDVGAVGLDDVEGLALQVVVVDLERLVLAAGDGDLRGGPQSCVLLDVAAGERLLQPIGAGVVQGLGHLPPGLLVP